MYDALEIRPGSVYCRVQLKAGHVNAEVGCSLLDEGALHVDLDEAGGGDLVEEQTVRIDEEVLLILVQSGGDLAAHALAPAVQVHEPEDSGELASQQLLALGVAHALDTANVVDWHHAI